MDKELNQKDEQTDVIEDGSTSPETKYVKIPLKDCVPMSALPVEELMSWMDTYRPPLDAYASLRTKTGKVLFVDAAKFTADESWWFIGDVHSDVRALGSIVSHIRTRGLGPERIVFLGDIFDRNSDDGGFETVRAFLTLLHDCGDRVLWLAGNHDAILTFNEEKQKFKVSTNRSEFAEYLNDHPELQEFGKKVIELIARLPIAVYFSNGVVASHGGVPHTDVLDSLKEIDDLERQECVDDFTWGRMTSSKFKFPDRTSHGHELGYRDFYQSCMKIAELATASGFKVNSQAIVCGHQHLFTDGVGYRRFEKYNEYPPSVCLYSSFALEPASAWGTDRRYAVPCALHWEGSHFEICGFEPTEDGSLHQQLMAEWQARFDAALKEYQAGK